MGKRGMWLRALLRRISGRTIRSRLTIVYGSLFLASGAVLLAVTGVLWSRATRDPISISAKVPATIAQIVRFNPAGADAIKGTIYPVPKGTLLPVQARRLFGQLRLVAGQQQDSDLHKLLLYSGIALGVMALIAIVAGFLIAGRVLRPLRTITSTTEEISASNLHERLELSGPDDELRKLGGTIDALLARLEHSFEAQRLFVANASHELRTPLSTMRASIDVAIAKPGPIPPSMRRLAGDLGLELDHIDQLLESFLTLARAAESGAPGEATPVLLDDLCRVTLARLAGTAEILGLDVHLDSDGAATVIGNETLLGRLVENLIENAVRHNTRGGYVRVRTETDGELARLVVENGGPILDQEEVVVFLQPFRRRGAERTGSENGFGLGLSIVSAIADSYGGSVKLQRIDAGGLRVVVELPLAARELAHLDS